MIGVFSLAHASAADVAPSAKPPCCREALPLGPYTDQSLYQLESKWTSDVGKELKLGVLRGRPQVLLMFFAQCEYACPRLVHNVKALEKAMSTELRDKVDFLLVSFDSEARHRKRSGRIGRKINSRSRDGPLLRGAVDDVRELSALLGINYVKDARGQFAHSNVITVLNSDGEIVYQHQGLEDARLRLSRSLRD
jgi:protein SCO1/2